MYFGFENISICYGKRNIVSNITMDFPKGEIICLIGKNGCGKSSLLKTVFGAVTPVSGRVVYKDRPVKKYDPRELAKRIGYLPQIHFSPPDIDVRTLVSYGRYPYRRFGRGMSYEDRKIIDETLDFTGLTGLGTQQLSKLSGGERQRAWLAMAVCQKPEILILDEPTTYLDIGYQIEVLDLIEKLNREYGTTIITVLHDINLAARYSHRLYAIRGGQVFACGCPEEIVTKDRLLEVFDIETEIFRDDINDSPFFIPLRKVI